MYNFSKILSREIIICCGSGGVGKTTIAAAIGIEGAIQGKNVLVLTIDPAKRLATSLGLSQVSNEESVISKEKFEKEGINLKGSFSIMMLDMKNTFDKLIERISPTSKIRDTILNNSIYQHVSTALSGSHEYMAMEQLYEIYMKRKYDLIVLDTPPTKHALDFLDAPRKIIDFLNGKVIKFLVKPYLKSGKEGFKIIQRGTAFIFYTMEKITGLKLLQDIAEFLFNFEGMYDGFRERAQRVELLLKSDRSIFLLITGPDKFSIDEATFFYNKLTQMNMPFGAYIVNKVRPDYLKDLKNKDCIKSFIQSFTDGEFLKDGLKKLEESNINYNLLLNIAETLKNHQTLAEIDAFNINKLKKSSKKGTLIKEIPSFEEDIHDIGGLKIINQYLFLS